MKIIALIHAKRSNKQIQVEKWELGEVPDPHITRDRTGATVTMPQRTGVVYIIGGEALDPLGLEPEKSCSTSSRPGSHLTTPSCPRIAAYPCGISSRLSGRLGLTSSRSSNSLAAFVCPFLPPRK